MTMTPDKLRDVAWALDALTKLSRSLLEPIAAMDEIKADDAEVTIKVTRDGNPLTPEEAQTLLEWLDGDEMQDDLRAEAKRAEESTGMYWCEKHAMLIECHDDCTEEMKPIYLVPMDTGEEEE